MPSKAADKDRKKDPDTPRSKDKRHKSSRSSRKADKAPTPPERRSRTTSPVNKRRASLPVPEREQEESGSPVGSKTSLPYPKFSKEHSREAVGSRESVTNHRLSYYTPDPTDLEQAKERSSGNGVPDAKFEVPPSPPETEMEQEEREDRGEKPKIRTVRIDRMERKGTDLQKAAEKLKKRLGRSASDMTGREKERHSHTPKSRNSMREGEKEDDKSSQPARRSKPGTPSKPRTSKQPTVEDAASSAAPIRRSSPISVQSATKSESTIDSGATERPVTPHADRNSSPATDPDSSPRTPTLSEPQYPPTMKETPYSALSDTPQIGGVSSSFGESPMPPPPPPPPTLPTPKVDYLLQNGGLTQDVPKSLLGAVPPAQLPIQMQLTAIIPAQVFSPFHKLLDDYEKVMCRSGSIAVATGYRSVARRLLDRLEAVFARDISSETCTCTICQDAQAYNTDPDDKRGVSWGEILEYVCGRQDLPQWPAFVMDGTQTGLGISSEQDPPMQKLDIDVPEEFREHYVRQSRKTKSSVDRWLDSQTQHPTSPPQDVDDETLSFAMLTRLEPAQRPMFSSLVGVIPSRPVSTAGRPTPLIDSGSELLRNTGLAIQRLYRLAKVPRDPEAAMYLLNNPHLHNVLATLAAISDHEWEVLTSGRFDGFLRSGADDVPVTNIVPPSRGITPATRTPALPTINSTPYSRGPTPASASAGAPVSLDEETEIAVLSEVEREIYLGMEALEGRSTPPHTTHMLTPMQMRSKPSTSKPKTSAAPSSIVAPASRKPFFAAEAPSFPTDALVLLLCTLLWTLAMGIEAGKARQMMGSTTQRAS